MKQTTVEFLVNQLGIEHRKTLLKQAKEMEKQQIIDAHGNQTKKSGGISNATYILTGEQYYNETFKNHLLR
jgi:hypothetical protein